MRAYTRCVSTLRHREVLPLDLPEHGRLELPLAGLGTRLVAGLIDAVLLAMVGLAIGVVALVLLVGGASDISGPVIFATMALLPVAGPLWFELRWHGQTPGKRLLQLRVVTASGTPARAGHLLLRNALRLVDFLPFGYFFGLSSAFASSQNQRIGDLVAGTLVVREDAGALTEVDPTDETPAPCELQDLPKELVQAAELLLDPTRLLNPQVRHQRVTEIAAVARAYRADLAPLDDRVVWTRLAASLSDEE